jgi:hypothetical protein
VSGFGRNDGFHVRKNDEDRKAKQILPLRGRMTTKKQRQRQKQIPPLRCGMTNKNAWVE